MLTRGGDSASGLRGQQGMQDLINALPQYEFVFIDSPPLPPDNITNLWWNDPL